MRFYAHAKDLAGTDLAVITVPDGVTVRDLAPLLLAQYEKLRPLWKSLVVAVNEEVVRDTHPLADGDTVALLPPIAGG
ncbi:MAG: MoaD/ThiS family protein [bacterium]